MKRALASLRCMGAPLRATKSPTLSAYSILACCGRMLKLIRRLCALVPFSRYLATIRIRAADLDPIDVLLDTTGTERNLTALAIVRIGNSRPHTRAMTRLLANEYDCPEITE
jgi:hypothetical protein